MARDASGVRSWRTNPPELVAGVLREALDIIEETECPPELRGVALVKLLDLLSARQVNAQDVQTMLTSGIALGNGHAGGG